MWAYRNPKCVQQFKICALLPILLQPLPLDQGRNSHLVVFGPLDLTIQALSLRLGALKVSVNCALMHSFGLNTQIMWDFLLCFPLTHQLLQVNLVVLICIDPPLSPNTNPRITFQLWRPALPLPAQPRIAEVFQNDDWTLNETPVRILLSDIFGIQVPAAYGAHNYVDINTQRLRQKIINAYWSCPTYDTVLLWVWLVSLLRRNCCTEHCSLPIRPPATASVAGFTTLSLVTLLHNYFCPSHCIPYRVHRFKSKRWHVQSR